MTLPDAVLLVIYALAVARVTGLIVSDSITEGTRDALAAWLDNRPKTLGAFVTGVIECHWCAGMWVALAVTPLMWLWGHSAVMLVPAMALAFSQATGMISNLGR